MSRQRTVVKVGTSTLTYENGKMNYRRVEALCKVLCDLHNSGEDILLVSSGAIGVGMGKTGLSRRPESTKKKQALAAIGQCELMFMYDKLFGEYNHNVAQILLTGDDIEDEKRRHNCENTLRRLLELGALPIINENDTVSTAQIEIGDNDTLAAIVGRSIQADLVILLTDIDGLFTADPHKDPNGKLIPLVEEITPEIMKLAGGAGSKQGTGGMTTKLQAAQIATGAGCDMIIANGKKPQILYKIVDGEAVGTKFVGKK